MASTSNTIQWDDDERGTTSLRNVTPTSDANDCMSSYRPLNQILKEFILEERERFYSDDDWHVAPTAVPKRSRTASILRCQPRCCLLRKSNAAEIDDALPPVECDIDYAHSDDEPSDDIECADIVPDQPQNVDMDEHMDKVIDHQVYRKFGYV